MTLMPTIPLQQRAERLWPDSPRNQAEWLRAVDVVRSTRRGWELDKPVTLLPEAQRGRPVLS